MYFFLNKSFLLIIFSVSYFAANFCSKSMNVGKNLVISAIPQETFSNHYKIVQQ